MRPDGLRWLRRHAERLLLTGALVLGATLRFTALDARGWWRDEAVTVELLRLPFIELLRAIPDSEGTPPLYYVLAWSWTRVFGESEVDLRSISALLGTATVFVVYLAGRELASQRVGLVGAFLAASSPLLVWHDQDGRAYALLVLLAALSFLFFLRLANDPSRRNAVGFGVASALALLTHYFAVFLVLPQVVWLLAVRGTRRTAIPAAAAIGVVGLALVPLALAQRGNVSWIEEVPRWRRAVEVAQHFLVGPQPGWERGITVLAGLVFVSALALLLLRGDKVERRAAVPAGVVGGATLAAPIVLAIAGLDYLLSRNVIVAWVPLALVVAGGFAVRRAGRVGPALALVTVLVGVSVVVATASTPKFGAEDWRGAARALGPPPPGGRMVILWPGVGEDPFRLYLPDATTASNNGAVVSEIALVTLGPRRRDVEDDPDLRSTLVPTTGGFIRSSREDEPYVTIVRFRSARPASVRIDELVATGPVAPDAVILVER